jgi:pyruvate dehydrogenase E2 component (dihydrolipoamide acetyltransferase)
MTIEYRLPELGEDIETGDVISVYVSAGDAVSPEEPLMEIETDKAAIEIPSPAGGVVKELHVKEGETIKVGQLLITIDDGAGNGEKAKPEAAAKEEISEEPVTQKEEKKTREDTPELDFKEQKDEESETSPSPEEAIKKEKATKKDEQINKESVKEEAAKETKQKVEATDGKEASTQPAPASPSVRRLARELGVDINNVTGTGPGGRISESDVRVSTGAQKEAKARKEVKEPVPETPAPVKETPEKTGAPVSVKPGEDERVKMSKVRRLTAERLTEAWKAPHVTQYDKADITELEELRKQYGGSVEKAGGKLTLTAILIKVISRALKQFPELNASVDMDKSEIVYKHYYNIGIAVDTERGLLVPVIKDADNKNLTELSVELADISARSRDKKITADELRGGTFTVTNLGGIGGTYFSPVLNAPQVGILGVSRASVEPIYIDEEFVPRLMLPLSLSYDHRLVDGANAIRFLRNIVGKLEEPHGWLLKVD